MKTITNKDEILEQLEDALQLDIDDWLFDSINDILENPTDQNIINFFDDYYNSSLKYLNISNYICS